MNIEIEMENGGIIKAELYPDVAPITVENFVSLIERNFFDGLIFHRVIPGFMIQGGVLRQTVSTKKQIQSRANLTVTVLQIH